MTESLTGTRCTAARIATVHLVPVRLSVIVHIVEGRTRIEILPYLPHWKRFAQLGATEDDGPGLRRRGPSATTLQGFACHSRIHLRDVGDGSLEEDVKTVYDNHKIVLRKKSQDL